MKVYNKLVRDKIPEIIRANDEEPKTHKIEDDKDYLEALIAKDAEESAELAADLCLEELADKLEVLYAIGKTVGFSPEDIEAARLKKRQERGGFEGRIFLESTQ